MAVVFESTNRRAPRVSFGEALLRGQAPDLGLYWPVEVPALDAGEREGFRKKEYHEIAHSIAMKYVEGEVPSDEMARIAREAYDFDAPLEKAYEDCYVMRLDRGPTASFKDFAARMMARLMGYFLRQEGRGVTILTATSGDTGSAVANAFHGMENIKVVVLFPKAEVTERQRRQMTTLGGNVSTIALDGKFDDCQALVKRAFADGDLKDLNLSSANSINFGRLMPQSVYYFFAHSRLCRLDDEIVFSVPSGNFGDLMGGMLAKRMGLPVSRFIAATNENDEFPRFMQTGRYEPIRPSKACISNAMNVGHPSNLARLFHLFGGWLDECGTVKEEPDRDSMRAAVWSMSVSDEQTREAIRGAYARYELVLEPHGAVGWYALQEYLKTGDRIPKTSVCLETADPAKFPDEIVSALGFEPKMPKCLRGLENLPENVVSMGNDYGRLKAYLNS
ncbi:MAG: threonine synthase [Candidatus Altiarchaeota archaeon]